MSRTQGSAASQGLPSARALEGRRDAHSAQEDRMTARPNYTDAIAHKVHGRALLQMGFDLVEVKHDGRWSVIEIRSDGAGRIFSRCGKRQGEFTTDLRPSQTIVLLGEHMIGTERAKACESLIVVFDCLHDGRHDCAGQQLWARRLKAIDIVAKVPAPIMTMVQQWDLDDRSFAAIWQDVVIEGGGEGLVAKRSLDPYSHGPHNWPHWIRIKETIEHDAVVLGVDGGSLLCMVDGVQWRVAAGVGDLSPEGLIGLKVTL